MKTILALLLLPLLAQAQTVTIPAHTIVVTIPAQTLPVTPATTPPPVVVPPPVITPPSGPVAAITAITALPMGWKVAFTEVTGAVNYSIVDPNQHWINTQAGSAHVTLHSPAFVQGGSGSASFVIYAQGANGTWSSPSAAAAPVKVVGALPAFVNPYWIYSNGVYNWSGDFSQPGGDTNTMLPQYGGTGAAPNPNDVEIDWFYTGDASFPAGAVRIVNSVTGNFSPAIPGQTVDLIAHAYAYWTAAIKPTYAKADFNLKFEGQNDAVVSALLPSLAKYVTAPIAGVFTQNAVNHVNVPFNAFAVNAPVYKMILQQNNGTQGTWLVDKLGLANSAQ